MADKIFINYRREDSIGTAGRLRDRLAEAFGEENLFMDVDNIPAGVDFVADLNNQVAACRVFLAVIGPNWLDAKDESGVRRLDNPDDFVTIEIAAALARDIRVIPVLVDNARMPKADKLPDPIKPLVRRNAVEVRNSQFRRDAETLVARMREAVAPGRPERTQEVVLLSFNAHLVASFLFNIGMFLTAVGMVFSLSNNYAGALATTVVALPLIMVGRQTLARDESVRKFGLMITVGGLLAVAAILVSPQFFRVGLLEDPLIQGGIMMMGVQFLILAQFFGWPKFITTQKTTLGMRMAYSPWVTGFTFLSNMIFLFGTWVILYRLTDSVAAALALMGVQLLVVGYCYVQYRKTLAANPALAS